MTNQLLTPEELRTICKQNGGQSAIARLLGISQEHMNRMCNGKKNIPNSTANHIRLAVNEKKSSSK